MHLKKCDRERARQHASRVRSPDIGRYTPQHRQERVNLANVRK